jgi:galactose mutarotase-like enzyme
VGWLRGFDEMLCRCGLEFNGAPEWGLDGKLLHTLHGRIANLPSHFVELTIDSDREEIEITGIVDEARLFGNNLRLKSTVRTRLGEPSLSFTDEILNLATHPCDLELLYHINFGPPLAAPGSKFYAPARTIAPRDPRSAVDMPTWQDYGPEQAGSAEVVLYFELAHDAHGGTGVILANPAGDRGVSLRFNVRELPFFCLWKNRQPVADGYCTGLEPALNFPNVKSFEKAQGRVVILAPGETRQCSVELKVHKGAIEIADLRNRLAQLESGAKPKILDRPQSGWSPDA